MEASSTRIAGGFSNPIDAEILGNAIYVIEFGGDHGIWEVTLPPRLALQLREVAAGELRFKAVGPVGLPLRLEHSSDLTEWETASIGPNPTGVARFVAATPPDSRGFFRIRIADEN